MLKAKLISALLKSNSGKQDLIKSIQDPNTCTRRMSILSVSNGLKILFLEIKMGALIMVFQSFCVCAGCDLDHFVKFFFKRKYK